MSLQDNFKEALATWATGVSVVAAETEEGAYGLTASSLTSLSVDPPMILVCLNTSNRLHTMIAEAGEFSVSILGLDQQARSSAFAVSGRGPTRDAAAEGLVPADGGVLVVDGAMAHLVCDHVESVIQATHAIVIGQVRAASAGDGGRDPLLYYRRAYRTVTGD